MYLLKVAQQTFCVQEILSRWLRHIESHKGEKKLNNTIKKVSCSGRFDGLKCQKHLIFMAETQYICLAV